MNIGILSDTHGNVRRTIKAITKLKDFAPAHIIHCGDIETQDVLTELAVGFPDPDTPVTCVLGNVDGAPGKWIEPLPHIRIAGRKAELEIDGIKIAVIHGDDSRALKACIEGQQYDYIFTGHTHERDDEQRGRTRVINPGAVHRASIPSCAVLNIKTGVLTYLDL